MSETTTTETDRLAAVEAKLDKVLAKLEQFESLAAGFISGPAITKMFAAIRGAGKQ